MALMCAQARSFRTRVGGGDNTQADNGVNEHAAFAARQNTQIRTAISG